jgi:hypothetical protein
MNSATPDSTDSSSIVGIGYTIVNQPMIVALLFGFAGTVFVGIYLLRYWKARKR